MERAGGRRGERAGKEGGEEIDTGRTEDREGPATRCERGEDVVVVEAKAAAGSVAAAESSMAIYRIRKKGELLENKGASC